MFSAVAFISHNARHGMSNIWVHAGIMYQGIIVALTRFRARVVWGHSPGSSTSTSLAAVPCDTCREIHYIYILLCAF